jgi:hypothetical protein
VPVPAFSLREAMADLFDRLTTDPDQMIAAEMDSDSAPGETRRLGPLKGAVHGYPRNRMAEQRKSK